MGCTGSKPHLLLTSSNQSGTGLAPSPQKGFILFNSKTLAYLRANENDIKPALAKRCVQKLSSNLGVTTNKSSSILKSKKNLISSSTAAAGSTNVLDENKNVIEKAVAYVMNYALNEFDIDSFSRSNHLSMKQIRKDILKKSTSDTANEYVNTPFYKVLLQLYNFYIRCFHFFFKLFKEAL